MANPRQAVLYVTLPMFALLMMTAAVQSQGIKVQCEQLGTSLDPFLSVNAFDSNKEVKEPTPTELHTLPLDSLRQRRQSESPKYLEPTLTGDEIVACFGTRGRELYFLKNSVENQRNRLRADKEGNQLRWRIGQITTITLGALATILLGLGNDRWRKLAIIPTALITAVGAAVAIEDYRGEITRAAKAESDLSKLNTEIEIALLEAATKGTPPPFAIVGKQVEEWWVRADGIIKGVDDDWLSRFSKEEKPEVKASERH